MAAAPIVEAHHGRRHRTPAEAKGNALGNRPDPTVDEQHSQGRPEGTRRGDDERRATRDQQCCDGKDRADSNETSWSVNRGKEARIAVDRSIQVSQRPIRDSAEQVARER
ncbi:MAG: hypothetical protein R2705_19165 [Ilumatobacteraceae bacterium]